MSKGTRGRRLALLSILVVFAVAGLIYANNKMSRKAGIAASKEAGVSVASEVLSSVSNEGLVFYLDELIIEAEGSVLRARKVNGEQAWSMNFGGSIKALSSSGSALLIVDDRELLSYMNKQGKIIWDHSLTGEYSDIYGDDNGSVLIEYKNGSSSKIEVFNSKGKNIGNTTLENAFVLSYAGGSDNSYALAVLDISSDIIRCKLISYDMGQMVWAKDFENELIPYIKYGGSNQLIAAGENKLYKFKNDGSIDKEGLMKGKILHVASGGEMIAAVINERGKHSCVSLDQNLVEKGHFELDFIPNGIFVRKNNYILYDRDKLLLCDIKGNTVLSYKSVADINRAYLTSEEGLYIVSNRKLQLLENK